MDKILCTMHRKISPKKWFRYWFQMEQNRERQVINISNLIHFQGKWWMKRSLSSWLRIVSAHWKATRQCAFHFCKWHLMIIMITSLERPVSLLGSKKYDVRKHSNKQRRAAEKTVHFDSTTTPSVTSNQSLSYDHSINQNSSFTDSSREYIWHQNVLDLNRNRSFEPENNVIRRDFNILSLIYESLTSSGVESSPSQL